MTQLPKYSFTLPPEEQVILRNRSITSFYAQLYQQEPLLYKWAGMAAFASFHIGDRMQMWDWEESGIKPFVLTCQKKNRSLEDDFQIIRIVNNRIFTELAWVHRAFSELDYQSFSDLLISTGRHPLIIDAFDKLNTARQQLKSEGYTTAVSQLIWKANTEILWHEQSQVVQPMFDKLTGIFSWAMTLFASFDYKINHHQTSRKTRSNFIFYMLTEGLLTIKDNWMIPDVTNLQHRWFWILNDVLSSWQAAESDHSLVMSEIDFLSDAERVEL